MKRKKLITALMGLAALPAVAAGSQAPLWMRYPAISPDGKTVAFSYKGDIYTVPATGGTARQLTTNPAFDSRPVWSPDGSKIAFASDRRGNLDVYVISAAGGEPILLTTDTGAETPVAFLDNDHVLFSANVMPDIDDSQFPSGQFPQIYSVATVAGARPVLFSSLPMEAISIEPTTGNMLYHDKKGYEDPWRKHHVSSIARDVWMASDANKPAKQRKFTKLTTFRGEDRNPVWGKGGNHFYYLSEQDSTSNIYRRSLDGKTETQLTKFTDHPVRFLSSSADGLLCFGWNGEIYTMREGGTPEKLTVRVIADRNGSDSMERTYSSGAGQIALSEEGKEIAFTQHGDVYVTALDYSTTKRITDTPQQERNVSFSPDGSKLVYSAERDGRWGIYMTTLPRKEDKRFTYARELKEEPLVLESYSAFQPVFSPDGKEVAFLKDRTELCVVNLADRKIRTVLPAQYNYSYSDGDVSFAWSPDSKWFLADFIDKGGWNNKDVVLVKADGSGEMTNLTQSGYSDGNAKWVLDGKAMIWESDMAGYRSHGSWGAEADVYIMFFDGEAYDNFRLSKEERELAEAGKKDEEKGKDDAAGSDNKDQKKTDKKKDGKKAEPKPEKLLTFDLANRRNRVMRLTGNSSHLADAALTPKGDKLYYSAAFEGGYDLWEHDLVEGTTRTLIKNAGGGEFVPDKKMDNIYISHGGIKKLDLKAKQSKPVEYSAEFTWRPAEEREYIFDHAWRQVKDKFYDPEIHGIDWQGYHDAYARFLPHINNYYDFQELLSEMLGELNGSHTGARFYGAEASSTVRPRAALGIFADDQFDGNGIRVAEIITGGPLDRAESKVKPGHVITAIDGQTIEAGRDYNHLLAGKANKQTLLTVTDPATGKSYEQMMKPISTGSQSSLLYKRWVEQKRAMVDSLSNGRVGYIHVKGMDSPSFRETFRDLMGRYRNCDAVIIDTRHNGGGWLHEDLAILLSGTKFATFEPRGQYVGDDPFNRWTKPSCVLMCEDNYSNAHGFPWTYQTLGLGKLIGAPVPGTMTAVWWETQIEPRLVFGIPQVGMKDMQGRYLENLELQPDIEIYNSPEDQLAGRDPQLERAVAEMLQAADAEAKKK
ncbi:MAG: PDZ domain-containing protein [Paramuribaculum sp.]|nr:PDZ domain-containing protein [Paramuribaculum sp.]